jgi:hypothetical protein
MHKLLHYLRDQPVIRERDADGQLMAAGFKWTEPVDWVWMMFGTGAFVLVFYAMACSLDRQTPPEFTRMVALAAAGCVLVCLCCGSISRGFAFERGGRIRNRGGWVNWLEMIGGIREHAGIASVEVTKTERGAAVAVFTTGGGTYILSDGLSEAKARLAAVQLTIALREMRESLTTVASYQTGQRQASAALID